VIFPDSAHLYPFMTLPSKYTELTVRFVMLESADGEDNTYPRQQGKFPGVKKVGS